MTTTPAVYFATLEIENVRCFNGRQKLDLTVNGRPAQWSILIGENGTGKTTLLECLSWMVPVPDVPDSSLSTATLEGIAPLTKGTLKPALPGADDEILETLPRRVSTEVKLDTRLAFGSTGFHSSAKSELAAEEESYITLGMNLSFDEQGELSYLDLTGSTAIDSLKEPFYDPLIVAYGANRHLGKGNLKGFDKLEPLDYERLSWITELCDVEELLMSLDYAARAENAELETRVLGLLKDAISKILPENPAVEIEIYPPDLLGTGRPGGVYARTFTGLVRMSSLSLGYRTTAGWIGDFAWRLSNRYPNSPNPFCEPAVVLIDEIDLHLHPLWQLMVMQELSELFPATQFIATSHSPIIVQVAEDANLILLEKQDGHINIENYPNVPRNLRVDQILTSLLFGLPSSRDPRTQRLLDKRAELLDKMNRTEEEESLLQDIRRKIIELPVAHDPTDQVAMDLIRRFAASLEQEEGRDS